MSDDIHLITYVLVHRRRSLRLRCDARKGTKGKAIINDPLKATCADCLRVHAEVSGRPVGPVDAPKEHGDAVEKLSEQPTPALTAKQIHMMRHALGLEGAKAEWRKKWEKSGETYRNHYSADEDADLAQLVALGFMSKHSRSFVPDPIFVVTDAGKAWLKEAFR